MVSYPGLVMIREWSGENVLGLHAYTFGDREKGSSPFVRSASSSSSTSSSRHTRSLTTNHKTRPTTNERTNEWINN